MFRHYTNTTLEQVGDKNLRANENLNLEIEMLTLVKVRKIPFNLSKTKFFTTTLLDVLEEPDDEPEVREKVLMEDYDYRRGKSGQGSVGGDAAQAGLQAAAAMDTVDGASSTAVMRKAVDDNQFHSLNDKEKKMKLLTKLTPKKEKLFCVTQIVYNSSRVKLSSEALMGGSLTGWIHEIVYGSLWGNTRSEMSLTVPKGTILGYRLEKIKTAGGNISIDGDGDDSCKTLEYLQDGIKQNKVYLQPLKTLPGSSRHDLLEVLREIVRDKETLTLLEETLDEEMTECPPPHVVSKFMGLLRGASSKDQQEADELRDAVHRLVVAMDSLPDGAAAALTGCKPKTLTVLQQLVSLMEDDQVSLPEPLPASLQEKGELRWVTELLCLTDQKLKELRVKWDRPDFPPEMLLELVCFVVQGLSSLMQP